MHITPLQESDSESDAIDYAVYQSCMCVRLFRMGDGLRTYSDNHTEY